MARPPKRLREAADEYVCVRVTNMIDVDLNRYRFDYDLTFAVLLMHPDGTVYHRYGGRPPGDADGWLSIDGLASLLEHGVVSHRLYAADPTPPKTRPKRTVLDIPWFAAKAKKQRVDCVHCHTLHDAETAQAMDDGMFERDDLWVWPDPVRIGLVFDPVDQVKVTDVREGSAAQRAGLRAGMRIATVGAQRIATINDVQAALHDLPNDATELEVRTHGEDAETFTLELEAGWKEAPAREYAWRAFKWGLSPAPGFGGKPLSHEEKKQLGLSPDDYAFRVTYMVTWGQRAHRGRAAAAAGLRIGDVVTSVGGRSDFDSIDHFHAWIRLTKRAGQAIAIELLRGGEPRTITLRLPE